MTANRSDGVGRRRPLRVTVSDARGRPVASRGLSAWLAAAAPARARGAVNVALVGDATMRRLNRTYRGVSRATDVLSFPVGDDGPAARRDPESPFLGDIVIATGLARRQARAFGHSYATELRILALHGFLHLMGYDHVSDRGQMKRVEEHLRRRAGLPTAVISRASGRAEFR